tara:strand:- start:30 stop:398 length:369 start_codon:yes stop_codon:yes gene_type:complete
MFKTVQTKLDDGRWLHTRINEDGSTYSFKFVKYWHPYELRHWFRSYAANSPKSYIRLGEKLNSIGLCVGKDYEVNLPEILDGIEKFISMNTKPFVRAITSDNRTLKQIYGTAKNFRKALEVS